MMPTVYFLAAMVMLLFAVVYSYLSVLTVVELQPKSRMVWGVFWWGMLFLYMYVMMNYQLPGMH